jgi:L-threonylcarbamoyladenylate synthase
VALRLIALTPGAPWQDAARRAGEVLRAGGVALLPAEGVYGLHARAEDPAAVDRLTRLKPRAGKQGFIGLIADPGDAARWAETGDIAESLIERYWPGALTLVLRARPGVPEALIAADGTVALRCPGSDLLREIVRIATGIVISTSANEPGQPPMIRAEGPLAESVDLVVDQGSLSGTPSTLVSVQEDGVRVLRHGAVRIEG